MGLQGSGTQDFVRYNLGFLGLGDSRRKIVSGVGTGDLEMVVADCLGCSSTI